MKNLARISDLAKYMSHQVDLVVVAAVYPYENSRHYLNSIHPHTTWVYLTFEGVRGREAYFSVDFEQPSGNFMTLNTSKYAINECAEKIRAFHREVSNSSRGTQIPFQEEDSGG